MEHHPQHGLPRGDWQSEASFQEPHYSEKQPQQTHTRTSKRYLWRIFRLGASLALTIAALVLTLIILVVGRHGNAGSDLALITVDMSNFAKFNPPTIELTNTTQASKTRRSIFSEAASAIGSAETSVETWASGAASAVETAAGAIATAAEAEADEIIQDIGDGIDEIESAVEGLFDKVMGTIQDDLNSWLKEVASSLDDLDLPKKMSLHLTTSCSTTSTNESTNSTETSCSQLFSTGSISFNATENNGTIFGFQPGNLIAKALGVFFVPASAQQDIRGSVDNATNKVEKLVQEAKSDVTSWSVDLLFIPIVVIYALAVVFTCLLLLILLAATALTVKGGDEVPARVYGVCGSVSAVATFFLLLGSVILTVVALVAYIIGLGGNVVGITVSSGSKLKWMSWAAFFIMLVVTGSLKVEEFVADCIFWWRFVTRILRLGKTKGGIKEAMQDTRA
ncbi:hypothetical protein N0V82_004319 [Gnomoniopsis sp. IMI 355080]|nr:hypothetical protein N0V82_004319 [Gnomoniopsis sp. IMI 355080]